uniref:Flagellar hook-associated protein 3 n=1 Tax=Desulfobacca acetoxidans TaxID=60893 RepID=A0A7V6DQX2_9BACT
MRVTMSTMYNSIQGNLQSLAGDLQRINASIASGKKYQSISDNPVDVGAILALSTENSQTVQYERNLTTAKSWLSMTESTLQDISNIVQASMALANQMATGTYNASQRQAAAQQIQGYLEEVMQVGNTELNGQHILAGYRTDAPPFTEGDWQVQPAVMHLTSGSSGTAASGGTYTGTTSCTYLVEMVSGGGTGVGTYRVSTDGGQSWTAPAVIPAGPINLGNGVQVTLGGTWNAGDRFSIPVYRPINYQGDTNNFEIAIGTTNRLVINQVGNAAVGGDQGANDLFQILAQLKSSLEANDPGDVGASLEKLRSYQAHITSIMAGLGASLDRVGMKENVYGALKDELTQQISDRGDTDLVAAVNLLNTKENAYQAALLSSSKVMGMSLMDYL